jgi:predicted kinase
VVTLFVAMGVPGSGKSTWCRRNADEVGATLVTSDAVRLERADAKQRFMQMHHEVDELLVDGHDVVVDACNVSASQRRRWLHVGRRHGARCVLVAFDVPLRTAMTRNAGRPDGQRVPEDVMLAYVDRWPSAKVLAAGEPWDRVVLVTDLELDRPAVPTSRPW